MTAEMWEEFKFAINPFAGDTKPNPAVTAEQNALSRASSKMMSKVLAITPHPFMTPYHSFKTHFILCTFKW